MNPLVVENNFLGRIKIDGLAPGPAGSQKVAVKFDLDDNGLLKVTATHNGQTRALNINTTERSINCINFGKDLTVDDNKKEAERRATRSRLSSLLQQASYMLEKVQAFRKGGNVFRKR